MRSRLAADALGVGVAKLCASLGILALGFRAVSDDDYARVVIAERFAATPHLDPSGTSWLPLPFWIYGGALRVFGGGLGTARVVAVVLGVGAALLLLGAARELGAGRAGALVGALMAALFPWSVWLGAATVPEAPAAALAVFGAATLASEVPRRRAFGALAVAAACFCRYEAWPIALVFAGFTLRDARRSGSRTTLALAGLALAPVALWLMHGVFVHGDALFFWKRVAGYRRALGDGPSLGERLLAVPRALAGEEPELLVGAVLVALERRHLERFARPALAMLALVVVLTAGELSGGGPTHHAGREALPVWYLLSLAIGAAVGRRLEARSRVSFGWFAAAAAVVLLGWAFRAVVPAGFPDRSPAVALGTRARELGAPTLLIDTPDYAYLAVAAAFGAPASAAPFDDRDPRHPPLPDAFVSEAALRARLRRHPGAWLAVTREHAALAARLGPVRAETPGLVLVSPAP